MTGTLNQRRQYSENRFTALQRSLDEASDLVGEKAAVYVTGSYGRGEASEFSDLLDFVPAFLANDIIRLWRTFCVNYEARTSPENEEMMKKRRLKSYKLKHSRLLTCYSALLSLMDTWTRTKTVSPADVHQMILMTPTARIEHIRSSATPEWLPL